MQLSEFAFRILLLFLPGVISLIVVRHLIYYKSNETFYFVLYSLVLGFLLYFLYFIASFFINYKWPGTMNCHVLESIKSAGSNIYLPDVSIVTLISPFFGLLVAFVINKKFLTRLAQLMNITKQFSEPDVWSYVLNSHDDINWAVVRDQNKNLYYYGWIVAFSDTYKDNELFMKSVKVYNNETGEFLYNIPAIYISRDQNDLTVEFVALKCDDDEEITNKGDDNGKRRQKIFHYKRREKH